LTLLVGLYSHLDSDWKAWNDSKDTRDEIKKLKEAGFNLPSFSIEQYFVSVIAISFVLSLISLFVSFPFDTTIGKKKLLDFTYHVLIALLLLSAGIVYIWSAKRIGKIEIFWTHQYPIKLRVGVKLLAGVSFIMNILLVTSYV